MRKWVREFKNTPKALNPLKNVEKRQYLAHTEKVTEAPLSGSLLGDVACGPAAKGPQLE